MRPLGLIPCCSQFGTGTLNYEIIAQINKLASVYYMQDSDQEPGYGCKQMQFHFLHVSLNIALQSNSLLEGRDERCLLWTATFPAQCLTVKCLRVRGLNMGHVCIFPFVLYPDNCRYWPKMNEQQESHACRGYLKCLRLLFVQGQR